MTDHQLQEKLERVCGENRRLVDENTKLTRSNKDLARQLMERNETLVMLEKELRVAKARRKR